MIVEIATSLQDFLVPSMPENSKTTEYRIEDLVYLMARLRDPDSGCPWDLKQTYKSIVSSTIEEAYEVIDAIEAEDYVALKEELGDYLFQAVFYCQLASEEGRFDIASVIDGLVAKLVKRHPHVFPDGTLKSRPDNSEYRNDQSAINRRWEELKQEEREQKGLLGVFDDVPKALPALSEAQKVQKRAARQAFDWDSVSPVYDKVQEEISELKKAVSDGSIQAVEDELGDLIFSCVNLSRHLKVDAETALRRATKKFKDRYIVMQELARNSKEYQEFKDLTSSEMEELWRAAKLLRDHRN